MRPCPPVSFLLLMAVLSKALPSAPAAAFEFEYSPPEWQTAICLPDDSQKSLVDRSGELLYHYNQGGREFGTRVSVEVVEGAKWERQEVQSSRVPIVRTLHSVRDLTILQEAFAVTDLRQTNSNAPVLTRVDGAGVDSNSHLAKPSGAARNDLVLVRVTNLGAEARVLRPRLKVETTMGFELQTEAQRAVIHSHEVITSSLRMVGTGVDPAKSSHAVQLVELRVPAGETAAFYVLCSGGGSIVIAPATLEDALLSRDRAVTYWEKAPLPYGRVQVPDATVQALLDSSIRNIWQAREIKKGLPAFQVGPTCYRGLWIVDGAFILEAAAMLGAGQEARSGVAYELTFQQPDGRIHVMNDFSKENGIVLWTCIRHAQLTQDKAWLQSLWPRLEKIAVHIQSLRAQTLTNASRLDDGLLPAGFPDGGIGGVHDEYTNPYWNLAGLKSFVQAAQWLGNQKAAARWEREFQDFLAAYRRSAGRDMKTSPGGHAYLPTRMDGQDLPQRGQWAFCHAVYPGQIFLRNDPVVASTLAMLQDTEREGMVYGTGWDATGIWNYFASFYGHAWLWQGRGLKAADALAAFAQHAAPTLVWREEQSLVGQEFRKVGDMPHNWASAEFIRLTVHLLALDRGEELHLLEGLPGAWTGPGMVTRLSGIATPFGLLEMSLKVDSSGQRAALSVGPLEKNCKKVVVHLPGGEIKPISPRRGGHLSFAIKN